MIAKVQAASNFTIALCGELHDGPAGLLIVFNAGEYQEISLSTVLAELDTDFHLLKAIVDKLPKKQEFITTGR